MSDNQKANLYRTVYKNHHIAKVMYKVGVAMPSVIGMFKEISGEDPDTVYSEFTDEPRPIPTPKEMTVRNEIKDAILELSLKHGLQINEMVFTAMAVGFEMAIEFAAEDNLEDSIKSIREYADYVIDSTCVEEVIEQLEHTKREVEAEIRNARTSNDEVDWE